MDLRKAALGFECRIRRAPTPIQPARRAAARGSQSGGNPELSSLSTRSEHGATRRRNTREMPELWPTPETSATPSLAPPSSRFYAEGELVHQVIVKQP